METRGSYHLLKNPVYLGKIVHKSKVHDGEHEPIVEPDLWEAVQARLKTKAPPRRRPVNDQQSANLRGLLTDPHGRPMVPSYGTKGTRRYCYYETRKDRARPGDAPATRVQRGLLERHLASQLAELLADEHAFRHLTGIEEAEQLRELFEQGRLLAEELQHAGRTHQALRTILVGVRFGAEELDLMLRGDALFHTLKHLRIRAPLPARRPDREARLPIDGAQKRNAPDQQLVRLLAEAREVQRLVLASPELSLNALGKREGRCRTQLGKLLRLSWISPRVVEAILSGEQPKGISRGTLLNDDLPIAWGEQERMLGFTG